MAKGEVKDKDKFCKIEKEDRQSQCIIDCQRASGIRKQKDACRFGCEFWPNGQFLFYLLSYSLSFTIKDDVVISSFLIRRISDTLRKLALSEKGMLS